MAGILDRYGIKEVADVTFYKIESDGKPGAPVLFLDTLKVSTIEQTAENTSARGGKGNAELIMWDYGKEITLTLEDALFSAKSLAMMYGADMDGNDFKAQNKITKTVPVRDVGTDGKTVTINDKTFAVDSNSIKYYNEHGAEVDRSASVYATADLIVDGQEIIISANDFPGNYYIAGDTYARNEVTGEDEFFQFIVPKAKMLSEVTLTMEAEGDPSTFNMNLKVLRPKDGVMMKLVQYTVPKN